MSNTVNENSKLRGVSFYIVQYKITNARRPNESKLHVLTAVYIGAVRDNNSDRYALLSVRRRAKEVCRPCNAAVSYRPITSGSGRIK